MAWRPTAIGVDVAGDVVRLALVERQGNKTVARRLLKADLPDATAEERHRVITAVVARALAEHKLKADCVVAGVPVAASVIRRLTVPVTGANKVAAAITFAVEPKIPYAAEEIYADYIPIAETEEGTDVLAFAIRRDTVGPIARAWSRAGVEVEVLAPDLLALLDMLPPPLEAGRDAVLYVRDGRGFLAVREDGIVIDFRALRGAPGSRALHSEAQLSLMAVLDRGTPVSQVLLIGDAEELTAAAERANVPYEVVDLLHTVDVPEAVQAGVGDPGPWTVALALAAQGVGANAHAVNFCRGDLRPAQSDALVGPLKRVGALALMALLLYAASLAAQRWALQSRRDNLRREMQNLVPGATTPDALRLLLADRQRANRDIARFVRPGPSTLDVLAACDAALRSVDGTRVRSVHLRQGGLQIDGQVADFNAVAQLRQVLEDSPLLMNVETTRSRRGQDGLTTFTVRATVDPSGTLADVPLPSPDDTPTVATSPVTPPGPRADARAATEQDRLPGAIPRMHVPSIAAPMRAEPELTPITSPVASEAPRHAPSAIWERAATTPNREPS